MSSTGCTRRAFLRDGAVAGLSVGAAGCVVSPRAVSRQAPMALDIHVHLFGAGDYGSGCYLSKTIRRSFNFILLTRLLKISGRGLGLDRGYAQALGEQIRDCRMDAVSVLAQDSVYDARGRRDMARTHFFVPNDYLFEFVRPFGSKVTPCVSINPDRRDCIDELERCVARGARLLKIHPPTQGVDLSHPKHRAFFEACERLDVLIMVHTGHEHAAPVIDIELANPKRMELGLATGCRMVACHSGSGWKNDRPDFFSVFVDLLSRYPRLYGDTSVMATMARRRDLLRAVDETPLVERLVHGSDFPFPSWPIAFGDRIGRGEALCLQQDSNLIDRDFELKQRLGIGGTTAQRGFRLVFGNDAWIDRPA